MFHTAVCKRRRGRAVACPCPNIQPPLCKGRCRTNVRRRDCKVDFICFYKIPQSFFCSKKTTAPFTREPLSDSRKGCPYGLCIYFNITLSSIRRTIYASDAPSFSQSESACPSGASLHITLSQTRLAPAALQSSSQASIHSPPPQP